jgi:hypothetical protein
MPLHRRTTQQQIDLIIIVSKPPQILDHAQGGLAIRDGGIHVVLAAVFVDAEALEGEVAAGPELGLHGARQEDGRLEAQVGDPVRHHAQLHRDRSGHLDRAAEGDFAVAFCWDGRGGRGGEVRYERMVGRGKGLDGGKLITYEKSEDPQR